MKTRQKCRTQMLHLYTFIYFTTITKQVIMLVGTDVCVSVVFVEETHLSYLITTWPSHMTTPDIESRTQQFTTVLVTIVVSFSHETSCGNHILICFSKKLYIKHCCRTVVANHNKTLRHITLSLLNRWLDCMLTKSW